MLENEDHGDDDMEDEAESENEAYEHKVPK